MFTLPLLTQKQTRQWLTLYLIYTTLIFCVIALRFYQVQPLPGTFFGLLFAGLYSVGHLGLLAFCALSPLFLLSLKRINSNTLIYAAIVVGSLAGQILIVDTFVYQQYRFHLNAMVIELFFVGGNEIISFPLIMWIQVIGILIFIVALNMFIAKKSASYILDVDCIPRFYYWFIPLCLLSANIIHIWADGVFNKDITAQSQYLPLSQPTTAKKLMAKYGLLNIQAYKQQALLKNKARAAQLNYPQRKLILDSNVDKLNVLFIIIDSWRAEMMNSSVTPNIAKFSENASQFNNHFSGSNNTRHGMFSLFYGIPGSYWSAILNQQTPPLLIEAFNQVGYQTQIFASAKLTMPEFDQTLFSSVKNLRTHSQGSTPWQRDINATNALLDHLVTTNQPRFNVLFLDAAHGYSIPDDFTPCFTPSLTEVNYLDLDNDYNATPFINLYKNALFFIDQQVGKVLDQVSSHLENTVVIITGDHGQEFNDSKQGFWGHNSNYSPFQTKVPLIVHWPNTQRQNQYSFTSHVDIVPTLMTKLFKVTNAVSDYSSGHSLFSEQARDSIILGRHGYYAIQDTQYIYELDRLGNYTIYDHNYHRQKGQLLNINTVSKALKEMSRFYQ